MTARLYEKRRNTEVANFCGGVRVSFRRKNVGIGQTVPEGVSQGDTQNDTQGVPLHVPEGVSQDNELGAWIEKQN